MSIESRDCLLCKGFMASFIHQLSNVKTQFTCWWTNRCKLRLQHIFIETFSLLTPMTGKMISVTQSLARHLINSSCTNKPELMPVTQSHLWNMTSFSLNGFLLQRCQVTKEMHAKRRPLLNINEKWNLLKYFHHSSPSFNLCWLFVYFLICSVISVHYHDSLV